MAAEYPPPEQTYRWAGAGKTGFYRKMSGFSPVLEGFKNSKKVSDDRLQVSLNQLSYT